MKNILKKFFDRKKITNQNHLEFEKLKNQPEIKKVFNSIIRHGKIKGRIGSDFLKKNQWWLN